MASGREWVEVILLDEISDNERIVYRASFPCARDGFSSFRFKGKRITKEDPVVITLPRREFLSVLC